MKHVSEIVLSALALLSLTFVSCAVGLSGSSSGTDEIATYETVKSALDKLKSDTSRIIGLSVEAAGSSSECNTEFGYAQAEIIDSDNNVFLQVFCPDVSKPRPWNNAKQVKYADVQSLTLDPAKAVAQIEQCKSMIPEGYKFLSLPSYRIGLADDKASFETRITLNVQEIGKESIESGGEKTEVYYELHFVIDPDGNVRMIE